LLQMPDEVSVLAACAAIESELSLDARSLVDIVNAERRKGVRRPVAASGPSPEGRGQTPPLKGQKADEQVEADFLALLTHEDGAFLPWALNELAIEVFQREDFRRLFERLKAGEIKAPDLNRESELEASFIRLEAETQPRVREAMLLDLAKRLKKKHLKQQMEALDAEKNEALKMGSQEKAELLAQQFYLLKKQYEGVETK
jgi:hypothetical protein